MQDLNGKPLSYETGPNKRLVASTGNTAITTTATDIALNAKTKLLFVTVAGANVFINLCDKATDTVTATSFDRALLAGQSRRIVLPEGVTTINAITDTGTVAPLIIEEYDVL